MISAPPFGYQPDTLCCERVPLDQIAEAVGTPCYVYSRRAITDNYHRFSRTFDAVQASTFYAVKANPNLSILRLLAELGAGFDVVSGGELRRLQQVGADWSKVMFSGVGKTREELRLALECGLLAINVESVQELATLRTVAAALGRRARVSLRLNPNVEADTHPYVSTGLRRHKFGIDPDKTDQLVEILRAGAGHLELVALGCHIGSQILEVKPFMSAFLSLKALAARFEERGFPIQLLDLGGGIGIPYRDEPPAPLERYAQFLCEHRDHYSIVLEPGRFIVGSAGVLLTQVLYRKDNREKQFVIVDAAMNDFLRPALYQAYHELLPLRRRRETSLRADVVGPVCESGDFLAQDRELPELQPGDLLAVMNAGAYGFSLASNYNSRLRPAEVMVDGERFQVVRRRERFEDLVRGET